MRGKVKVWKRDFSNPLGKLFGWGFIEPDGLNGNKKDERVYFNEKSSHYAPVMKDDVVEFVLSNKTVEGRGPTAHSVRKV